VRDCKQNIAAHEIDQSCDNGQYSTASTDRLASYRRYRIVRDAALPVLRTSSDPTLASSIATQLNSHPNAYDEAFCRSLQDALDCSFDIL
jgi:hypothetical protein